MSKRRISTLLVGVFLLTMCVSSSTVANASGNIEENVKYSIKDATENEGEYILKNLETGEETYYDVEITGDPSESVGASVYPAHIPQKNMSGVDEQVGAETEEEIEPETIIGEDGRTKVTDTTEFPYSAVLYIEIKWSDGTLYTGTAFMISDNVAVTAAHCIYDSSHGGWAKSITVWPGKDGFGLWNNPYGSVDVSYMSANSLFVDGNEMYDYGVLILKSDVGDETGWFGLTYSDSTEDISGTNITISGYPGDDRYYQYTMSGTVSRCQGIRIFTTIDIVGGNSGSPVYTSENVVTAICYAESASENILVRMYDSNYEWFMSMISEY